MGEKLARWFIFGVVVALLPLGVKFVLALTDGPPPSLTRLLSRGELLLTAVAIAAAAVGELIGIRGRRVILNLLIGGAGVLTILFSSLYFAFVTDRTVAHPEVVAHISIAMFVMALLTGGATIMLVEEAEQ
jgi:hypothetical protein